MARLIDLDKTLTRLNAEPWWTESQKSAIRRFLNKSHTVDAVEAVRCRECLFAKPYERTDGETGYYCHFGGHSFKYGTNWERVFNPIKEADDFCSYGERRCENG